MNNLSELLNDFMNMYKSSGMTGGALPPALVTDIGNGNFRSVYDHYFNTTVPGTNLLSLDLKDANKAEFIANQVELVTQMLAYHTAHAQAPATITVSREPKLSEVTGATQNPPHNKYWETLGIAAKIARGGAAPGPGAAPGAAPAVTPLPLLNSLIAQSAITDDMILTTVTQANFVAIETAFRNYIGSFPGTAVQKRLQKGRLFLVLNRNTSAATQLSRGRFILLCNRIPI